MTVCASSATVLWEKKILNPIWTDHLVRWLPLESFTILLVKLSVTYWFMRSKIFYSLINRRFDSLCIYLQDSRWWRGVPWARRQGSSQSWLSLWWPSRSGTESDSRCPSLFSVPTKHHHMITTVTEAGVSPGPVSGAITVLNVTLVTLQVWHRVW